jgi:hypothetical protein
MQQAGTAVYQLDDMDFARRLATERELDRDEAGPGGALRSAKAVWDESGNFVLYPTMLGIKGESCDEPHSSDLLELTVSGKYCDQQGVSSDWKGRGSAVLEFGDISRRTSKEGCHNTGPWISR